MKRADEGVSAVGAVEPGADPAGGREVAKGVMAAELIGPTEGPERWPEEKTAPIDPLKIAAAEADQLTVIGNDFKSQGGMILEDTPSAIDKAESLASELCVVRPELRSRECAVRITDGDSNELYRTPVELIGRG